MELKDVVSQLLKIKQSRICNKGIDIQLMFNELIIRLEEIYFNIHTQSTMDEINKIIQFDDIYLILCKEGLFGYIFELVNKKGEMSMFMFEKDSLVKVVEGEMSGLVGVVVDVKGMEHGCYVALIGKEDVIFFENKELGFATAMDTFETLLQNALKNETPWMYVLMQMPNTDDEEIIVNPITNFEAKLEYYKNQYDEEMCHKYVEGLRIVGFGFVESLDEIEKALDERFDESEDDMVVDSQPVDTQPEIKVGDKVKITNAKKSYRRFNGEQGIVTETDRKKRCNSFDLIVKINGDTFAFNSDEVELIRNDDVEEKTQSKFKVGDKVIVVNDLDKPLMNGKIGVVCHCHKEDFVQKDFIPYPIEVEFDFTTRHFKEEEIALVDETEIKKGDTVVVHCKPNSNNYDECNGKMGKVGCKVGQLFIVQSEDKEFVLRKDELVKIK